MCFDFTKTAPTIKMQTFLFFWRSCFFGKFGQVWWNFGQKWCLRCFDLKNCANIFLRAFSLEFFSGKFAAPKICLLLHP